MDTHTDIKTTEVEVKWKISNASLILKKLTANVSSENENDYSIISKTFSTLTTKNKNWRLKFRVNKEFYCYLDLILITDTETSCYIKYYFIDKKQIEKQVFTSDIIKFDANANKTIHSQYVYGINYMEENFIVNDMLTIICCIKELGDILIYKSVSALDSFHYNLANSLKNLLDDSRHSDITLVVDEEEFKAHKCILSARSPVFSAMFSHDMKESQTSKVFITDSNSKAVKKFIDYIYTDKIEKFENEIYDLWILSDKYDVKSLKEFCESYIYNSLTVESALKTLKFVEKLGDTDLMNEVLSFINNHRKRIITTDEFAEMEVTHPHLISELYRHV